MPLAAFSCSTVHLVWPHSTPWVWHPVRGMCRLWVTVNSCCARAERGQVRPGPVELHATAHQLLPGPNPLCLMRSLTHCRLPVHKCLPPVRLASGEAPAGVACEQQELLLHGQPGHESSCMRLLRRTRMAPTLRAGCLNWLRCQRSGCTNPGWRLRTCWHAPESSLAPDLAATRSASPLLCCRRAQGYPVV